MTLMTLSMTYIGHYPEVISPSFHQKVPYTNSVSSLYVGLFILHALMEKSCWVDTINSGYSIESIVGGRL